MRSMLFVPGDSPRKFEKASDSKAGALILDLEDSVATEKKEEARKLTRVALSGRRGAQQLYVRVNALDTGMTLLDLAAVMSAAPDGIVLPKSHGGDDIRQLSFWLDAFEAAAGLQVGATRIVAVATETAASLFGLASYKESSPRLVGLMWGAEDLAASLGASENRSGGVLHSPFRLARDMCLMGAAAADVAAIDTVYTDIDNLVGLEEETRAATDSRSRPSSTPSMSTSSTPLSSPPPLNGRGPRRSSPRSREIPISARSVSTAKWSTSHTSGPPRKCSVLGSSP